MIKLRLTALAAALLLSLGAAAQSPPKPPSAAPAAAPLAATDASRREARELGVLLRFSGGVANTMAQMHAQMVQAIAQRSGKPLPEASAIVDEVLMPDFKGVPAKVEAVLVENLAANFTAADLAQMRVFFASPVGQRWIQTMPSVESDNRRQIQLLGQETFRDAIQHNVDALRARGVNF